MKKIIYSVLLAVATIGVTFAQEEDGGSTGSSSNGGSRLPEAGDIGLGFDAYPLFNLLSGSNADANVINNSIFVRYFLDEATAVRVNFSVYQMNNVYEAQVWTGNEGAPLERVTDKRAYSYGDFIIGLGLEKRRGGNKVQGYYGADFQFERSAQRQFYEYGNALSLGDQNPVTYYFSGAQLPSYNWVYAPLNSGSPVSNGRWYGADGSTGRMLADYDPTTVSFSVNGVIGAEVFIASKLSLGGEFKLGYAFSRTANNGVTQWEYIDKSGNRVEEERPDYSSPARSYGLRPIAGGNIILNMYF